MEEEFVHIRHTRHRPPRLHRLHEAARPFYMVTFNTHRRRTILAQDGVHEAFRDFCANAVNHNVVVGRYVIMPDHVHLFVALKGDGITLTKWVKSLRSVLGKQLLKLGVTKPHWQEGFFDHLLRSGESYSEKWDYVRMNPVRAGLCQNAEDWQYQGEIVPIRY